MILRPKSVAEVKRVEPRKKQYFFFQMSTYISIKRLIGNDWTTQEFCDYCISGSGKR